MEEEEEDEDEDEDEDREGAQQGRGEATCMEQLLLLQQVARAVRGRGGIADLRETFE